jgi:hypothetical protein
MEIIEKWKNNSNFWDCFPQFKAIEVFNKFSKNKDSSNIMWAIAFCIRRESPMYNLPEKWELAAKDIAKKKIDWNEYEEIINLFKQSAMTQAERSLLAWEELMIKRDKYLKVKIIILMNI